jgi:hypothetical protein
MTPSIRRRRKHTLARSHKGHFRLFVEGSNTAILADEACVVEPLVQTRDWFNPATVN